MVQLLLKSDSVDADSKCNVGWTPLSWAAREDRETIVQLFLEKDDIEADSKDKNGRTPPSWAAGTLPSWVISNAFVGVVWRMSVVDEGERNERTSVLPWTGNESVVPLLAGRGEVEVNSKDDAG